MAKPSDKVADYIQPLNMNGLQGRMLYMPARKTGGREMLVVYGHHATLERWWGLVQNFNVFGSVTMPDLPGFGGMDSFYKIGQKPTIDNMADYLATFIKLRYKRRRVTIVGISFGFVVATRMLQRYPDLAKKVDLVISAAGFAHHDDFTFSPVRMFMYRLISKLVSWPIISTFFRYVFLNPWVLRKAYAKTHNAKHKFAEATALPEQFETLMNVEIQLWHLNDVRTHFSTSYEFLKIDNCKKRVAVPVWHVYTTNDQYFDANTVEQHLRVIFEEYESSPANMKNHVVSVLATKKEAASLLPAKLRKRLLSKPS
ncbi:MAG TPA: alpha/beta hydrolase [Candidatus Pristimantibacillus sp.]|nr:alpha/beta hydrolase [Candidatus Pristimantibacillus sp.]